MLILEYLNDLNTIQDARSNAFDIRVSSGFATTDGRKQKAGQYKEARYKQRALLRMVAGLDRPATLLGWIILDGQ